MNEIQILKRLVSEANVQINVLSKFCDCSFSAISKYIHDESIPSEKKNLLIKEGLKKYKELINDIIKE